jgi:signal transduction histidine kinase
VGGRPPAEDAVQQTIVEASLAGERVVSVARLLFCLAVGTRSVYYWVGTSITGSNTVERMAITLPVLAIAIGFSTAMLLRVGAARHARAMLHVSVTLDAVVGFVALLPNSLWPPPNYQGLPYMMDTASILVLTMATGLRHSASAAALGGALNVISYVTLATVDRAVSGGSLPVHGGHYTMYGILLASTAAIALIIAIRTRRLVEAGARAAVAADQANRGLRTLLRDHHDLRTAITSAQINADLARDGAADAIDHLRHDLGEIRTQVDQVKARALEELAHLDKACPTPVADVTAAVVAALRPRFPAVEITATADGATPALVAGGETTLRRILSNLLVNACEGDGRLRARRVEITARANGERVTIEIVDDGPGLPDHVARARPGEAASTKPTGIGVGIGLVHGLVTASGGSVGWNNRDGGGARVVVELPAAS